MIRFIAAIDSRRGIADDNGIPWNLPTDVAYYRAKVRFHDYLIGYGTYANYVEPLADTRTYVATTKTDELRPGFNKISDPSEFLGQAKSDVWVGGGSGLFNSTLHLADELYLTRIHHDFHCTKFFPLFESDFELIEQLKPQTENGLTFQFETWRQKS